MRTVYRLLLTVVLLASGRATEQVLGAESLINSVGMKMIRIEPEKFAMGSDEGDADEHPVHNVTISRPFYMAATEVTNAQYEQFDPEHKKLRGKRGLSKKDDEAVVFVSWHDAVAFCTWLSEKERKPYRPPTEAEWEYACRAGTTTAFSTGDTLTTEFHRAQGLSWDPKLVDLSVGRTPPNAWGLHDMHGNVEEWCLDWYGPYGEGDQTDPIGRTTGEFKVTRGGSHNTEIEFLRSANRLGTLPEDKHWLIGFRIVQAEMPQGEPLPPALPKLWQRDVKQVKHDWSKQLEADKPYFAEPLPFVLPPQEGSGEPFYPHNHCPSITWCDNGDLLAVWFSTRSESGREMTVLASWLRADADSWEPSSEFFKAPDRNMTGSSLFKDGQGTLYHFNGLEAGAGWGNLALVLRTSTDNGVTWSPARLINAEHQRRNQVINGTLLTRDGTMIQPCDAVSRSNGGTALHVSRDGGRTWADPGLKTEPLCPKYGPDTTGGTIAGIHAGVVQLADGRLMALGRGDSIDGRMPRSISTNMGQTWTYAASEFPPIGSGQRLVLMRLREGPLLLVSFTDAQRRAGMIFYDTEGREFTGQGMFAAVSFDEGESWPVRKLLTPGGPRRQVDGGGNTRSFFWDIAHAEPAGYLAATQTPDGIIHLLSSRWHYRFNLAWLKEPNSGPAAESTTSDKAKVVRHVKVFYESGRFTGWPANHGIWFWGDEILVGFTLGDHKEQQRGHTIDWRTAIHKFARSLDGGLTWSVEDAYEQGIHGATYTHVLGDRAKPPVDCPGGIDFAHPDFALTFRRVTNDHGPSHFYYSYDRGKSWFGPFGFPDLDPAGITNRTDYIIDGKHEMLSMLSIGHGRTGVARTTDGGRSWNLVSYVGPDFTNSEGYSLMPSTVRLSPLKLLTVIRHGKGGKVWLTSYLSEDNARTWQQLDDPVSDHVNTPPALVQLRDSRLALAYVHRGQGSRLCAKLSSDEGQSWSDEIVLREKDGANTDVGYPRMVQRPDGKLVVVYYWNHSLQASAPPYRYIAATIWDPGQ